MASVEENMATLRRLYEELNRGNVAVLEEVTTPANPNYEEVKARLVPLIPEMRAAFPDWRITIDEMVATDDRIVCRTTGSGTHTGEYQGVPPTGQRVTVPSIGVWAFDEGGKVANAWGHEDPQGLLEQLGDQEADVQGFLDSYLRTFSFNTLSPSLRPT